MACADDAADAMVGGTTVLAVAPSATPLILTDVGPAAVPAAWAPDRIDPISLDKVPI